MAVGPIENLDEFHKVVNSPMPAIIYFWATWCNPCKMINPVFVKESDKPENVRLQFYKVDADHVEGAFKEVDIQALPVFIVYHKGMKLGEVKGALPTELEALIAKHRGL